MVLQIQLTISLGAERSEEKKAAVVGDSDNAVVEAASISDPFIIGNEATQIDSHLSSKSKTRTVIPPLVADSNSKRAKSGGHGGPRDGSGPKPKDVAANMIRKGRPRSDRVH